mmetsp:Transcript_4778/g.10205  ORF Transcript_4778/g.10205 Transcript_4778/m.10205 type:complete len:83 (-) Transcript_4778:856-1104(-)
MCVRFNNETNAYMQSCISIDMCSHFKTRAHRLNQNARLILCQIAAGISRNLNRPELDPPLNSPDDDEDSDPDACSDHCLSRY